MKETLLFESKRYTGNEEFQLEIFCISSQNSNCIFLYITNNCMQDIFAIVNVKFYNRFVYFQHMSKFKKYRLNEVDIFIHLKLSVLFKNLHNSAISILWILSIFMYVLLFFLMLMSVLLLYLVHNCFLFFFSFFTFASKS